VEADEDGHADKRCGPIFTRGNCRFPCNFRAAINRLLAWPSGYHANGSDVGGDLQRRPTVHFFQEIAERLGEQTADLAGAFDNIDESKKIMRRRIAALSRVGVSVICDESYSSIRLPQVAAQSLNARAPPSVQG
jgi:hypothetical protein